MSEPIPVKIEGYGWKRQTPDWNDQLKIMPVGLSLPRHFDLYSKMPPIWNQSRLGSCTAHGVLRAYLMDRRKQGQREFMPSRLFQYYNSRWLEHTVLVDSGATCRDAIKAVVKWGACDETLWPYDISKFAQRPPDAAFAEAEKHQALVYQTIPQTLYQLKAAIFSGYAVVFGFQVYENFEVDKVTKTGLMWMPEGRGLGGHCVVAIGWNSHNYIMCANSWGTKWGDPDFPGCFWMPPDYISNSGLAADFWTIETTEA